MDGKYPALNRSGCLLRVSWRHRLTFSAFYHGTMTCLEDNRGEEEKLMDDDDEEEDDDEEADTDDDNQDFSPAAVKANKSDESLILDIQKDPLMLLNQYYREQHGFLKSASSLAICESTLYKLPDGLQVVIWTATLHDPVRGTIYEAGTRPGDSAIPITTTSEDGTPHTKIYYRKKSMAISAAAARALDTFQYLEHKISHPRFCDEDPSKSMETDAPADDPQEDQEADSFIENTDTETESGSFAEATSSDYSEMQVVSSAKPTNAAVVSPAERALVALSGLQTLHSGRHLSHEPRWKAWNRALSSAEAWLETQEGAHDSRGRNRIIFSKINASSTLSTAKTILSSLANVTLNTPIGVKCMKTSSAASRILKRLQDIDDISIDIDVYNLFFLCYKKRTSLKTAQNIQSIVDSLARGDDKSLPRPNQTTYDILIQTWAYVGGEAGRYQPPPDAEFVPTRDSFLAVLSSNSYEPFSSTNQKLESFDLDFLKTCVERMRQLSKEKPENSSLVPDVHVYNTAIPWAGGFSPSHGGKFARSIPFPSYGKIFGSKHDKFGSIQNVLKIQEWVDHMISNKIEPDIVTREALIQGWVRTGSAEGVMKAEEICRKLLEQKDDKTLIRLQTFIPVFAGLLCLNDDESLGKALSLYKDLKERSDAYVDERTQMALISACANRIIDSFADYEDKVKYFEFLFTLIEDLTNRYIRDDNVFLGALPFSLGISAASFMAKLEASSGKNNDQDWTRRIEDILTLFQDTVIRAGKQHHVESSKSILPDNVVHLLTSGHLIFAVYTRELLAISELCEDRDAFLLSNLFNVERCVRQVAEFNEIASNQAIKRKVVSVSNSYNSRVPRNHKKYEDTFTYRIVGTPTSDKGTNDFPRTAVRYAQSIRLTNRNRGDLVRFASILEDLAKVYSDFEESQKEIQSLTASVSGRDDIPRPTRVDDREDTSASMAARPWKRQRGSYQDKANARKSRSRTGRRHGPRSEKEKLAGTVHL